MAKRTPQFHQHQSGQVGIIIILIMIVLLTIGISLAAQTSKDLNLSTQESDSTRVFNAAEAGVEQVLATDLNSAPSGSTAVTIPNANSTVSYTVQKLNNFETRIAQGDTMLLQLKDASGNATVNSVRIDWAKETSCTGQTPASLIIAIYSFDATVNPVVTRVRFQAVAACAHGDNITVAGSGSAPYFSTITIPVGANDAFMRIKPMYNDTEIKFTGSGGTGSLPSEAYKIRSTAVNAVGTETRTVEVTRSLPTAPSIMDYAVFSGTTIVQ